MKTHQKWLLVSAIAAFLTALVIGILPSPHSWTKQPRLTEPAVQAEFEPIENAAIKKEPAAIPECQPLYDEKMRIPKAFDGKVLYNLAYLSLYCLDLATLEQPERDKFAADFKHRHDYDGALAQADTTYQAITEMVQALHMKHDRFFTPEEWSALMDAENGSLVGIGAAIGVPLPADAKVDKEPIVSETLPLTIMEKPQEGSPAAKAGLTTGDIILSVNGDSTVGKTITENVKRIRGTEGTEVSLSIGRKDADGQLKSTTYKLTREKVETRAVTTRELGDGFGYIKLSDFLNKFADEQMFDALTKFKDAKGIIIDLRNNPGGELNNALFMGEMLIDKGAVYNNRSRDGVQIRDERYFVTYDSGKPQGEQYGAYGELWLGDKKVATQQLHRVFKPVLSTATPIVVLINQYSASASEILSGMLKANGRAVLVGTETYGKNVGQQVIELPYGAGINVTTFEFWPGGVQMHGGIQPDIVVEQPLRLPAGAPDTQLQTALRVLRGELQPAK